MNNYRSVGNKMISDLCNEYMEKKKTKTIKKAMERRGEGVEKENSRILRSFHRKKSG
jgi:hypothetical protein